ncbi:MAG: Cof-type HAD-IIB family hydrolase [Fusobacteriaceae bacterium]|nr:Cof-type HAD-IIB family hydrolase [Fusobacteriaceae bacterium]
MKAVVCDLDGTLLNGGHTISAYTRDIIGQVIEKGNLFFIATGRHHLDAFAFKKMLGLHSYLISSNGARIHDQDDREIYRNDIPPALARELFTMPLDGRVHKSVFRGERWYVESVLEEFDEFHKESGFKCTLTDFETIIDSEIIKFLFLCEESEQVIAELDEAVRGRFGTRVNAAMSNETCLEVMNRDVSKGHAIKAVMGSLGIPLSDVISFGDGLNDKDMLTTAGTGYLMGNAHKKLKAGLPGHEILETNDNDGVAKKLKEIFL